MWLAAATMTAFAGISSPPMDSRGVQVCIGAPVDNPAATYKESRQFVDAQGWWTPGPGQKGDDFGHAHVGACIPEREQMTGKSFPLDIRLQLHNNPAGGSRRYPALSIVTKGADYETTIQKHRFTGWSCPVGNCVKWVRTTIPLKAFDASGLQELRFRFFVDEPDGKRMIANMNWQTYIRNGKPTINVSRRPYLRGKGWYTHAGYCEASIRSVPLPDTPVWSPWRVTLAQSTHSSDGSLPVTHHTVSLDPDFHAHPPKEGTAISSRRGPLNPTALNVVAARGLHRLFQRADCRDSSQSSTNSGVLAVPFVVR